MKKLSDKIETQKLAVSTLDNYAREAVQEGAFSWPLLVTGGAGVGKTEICKEYAQVLAEETGAGIIEIDTGGELSRSDSAGMLLIVDALKRSLTDKTVILIDEFQLLPFNPTARNGSPVQRFWNSLIYGSGQGWNRYGSLEFKGDDVPFNGGNVQLIGTTNLPEQVGGGRNFEAVKRRFKVVNLPAMSDREMRKALPAFFEKKGFEIESAAMDILARRHRGTFGAAAEISQHFPKGELITKETVQAVTPLCNHQARGFTRVECQALLKIFKNETNGEVSTQEATTAAALKLSFPELNIGEFYRHCQAQTAKVEGQVVPVPFLALKPGGAYVLTSTGRKFVKTNSAAFSAL